MRSRGMGSLPNIGKLPHLSEAAMWLKSRPNREEGASIDSPHRAGADFLPSDKGILPN